MARYKGLFKASANYEPQIAAPFDARSLVEAKADLIAATTWQQKNGDMWIYSGMIVSVSADIDPEKRGLYILSDAARYMEESAWIKLAHDADLQQIQTDIEDLQQQIDNIEVTGGSQDVEVETEADLPAVGNENITYYIKENSSIKRWDSETQTYISYGGDGENSELDVELIYGGDSNGNY